MPHLRLFPLPVTPLLGIVIACQAGAREPKAKQTSSREEAAAALFEPHSFRDSQAGWPWHCRYHDYPTEETLATYLQQRQTARAQDRLSVSAARHVGTPRHIIALETDCGDTLAALITGGPADKAEALRANGAPRILYAYTVGLEDARTFAWATQSLGACLAHSLLSASAIGRIAARLRVQAEARHRTFWRNLTSGIHAYQDKREETLLSRFTAKSTTEPTADATRLSSNLQRLLFNIQRFTITETPRGQNLHYVFGDTCAFEDVFRDFPHKSDASLFSGAGAEVVATKSRRRKDDPYTFAPLLYRKSMNYDLRTKQRALDEVHGAGWPVQNLIFESDTLDDGIGEEHGAASLLPEALIPAPPVRCAYSLPYLSEYKHGSRFTLHLRNLEEAPRSKAEQAIVSLLNLAFEETSPPPTDLSIALYRDGDIRVVDTQGLSGTKLGNRQGVSRQKATQNVRTRICETASHLGALGDFSSRCAPYLDAAQ